MLRKGIIAGVFLFFAILIFNVTQYAMKDLHQPMAQYLEARGLAVEYVEQEFPKDLKLFYHKSGKKTEVFFKDIAKKNTILLFWAPHYTASVEQLQKFAQFINKNPKFNAIIITLNDGKPLDKAQEVIKNDAKNLENYGYYYDTNNKSFFSLLEGDNTTVPPLYILFNKNGKMYSMIPGSINWSDEKLKHTTLERGEHVQSVCGSCQG